jgi:hypothetical protein
MDPCDKSALLSILYIVHNIISDGIISKPELGIEVESSGKLRRRLL